MATKFERIPRGANSKYTVDDPGEEVVVSGISGRFPDSDNVNEFAKNLYNKVDLVTDDDRRWKIDHPEIPPRTGKINNIDKFDALFFGVHFKQAHTMDPQCRMLMEHAYEAIIDAGINPKHIRGSKTGVFVGVCYSESEKIWFYERIQVNGFGLTGCSRAMMANRISYSLDLHGPSLTIDTACSSTMYALEEAYRAIRDGRCDAAIVAGANICLHPSMSLQFTRLGILSPDGSSKCFDEAANGYARSETVAAVYLQKAKNAKRIYTTVVHAKTNCDGFKEQSITFPSSIVQAELLRDFYDECGIPPTILDFMEAHATGTMVGDPEEIAAIEEIFLNGRTTPLLIGSVKSNMGHAEPASGVSSLAKVIISMENHLIAPNLHFNTPRKCIKPLADGKLKVVSEPMPWNGGYVGINSFGFGGSNAHALLKSFTKEKINNGAPTHDLPIIVAASGRTDEAVDVFLKGLENRPIDVEMVGLVHNLFSDNLTGHLQRGYTILGQKISGNPIREIDYYDGTKRPLWFVFSGMGSQWPTMGAALMIFPVFRKAIERCDAVLRPRGVDIVDIITNPDKHTFDSILNSFVGIAAIQIGLVDLLQSVNIVPDFIIGHSVGELGCAYADECLTAEQMILSAYFRGKASLETDLIRGSLAAVGIGYNQIKDMCPPDIEVACHNGFDSCTISGPAESMKNFVSKLQEKEIFAREVPCGNIAYHSRYIAPAGPRLLSYLKDLIPDPKPRSSKWMSTSVPRHQWSSPEAKYSSAEYFTNNLLNAVLFEETSKMIPKNAVTLEIAPHGLLQSILRQSMHRSVTNIPLMKRGHEDNAVAFLQGLGKLYNTGYQPKFENLYPPIEFPVSRGTPMLSPLIRWNHTEDWFVASYKLKQKINSAERILDISTDDEGYEYMAGHVINGRTLLPATGYLMFVWDTFSMLRGQIANDTPIIFENIKFLRATTLSQNAITLNIIINKGNGDFEISERGTTVVTGKIRPLTNSAVETIMPDMVENVDDEEETLSGKDVYKELRLRGYQYSGLFRGIESLSVSCKKAHIRWSNWVAFMDNMLQLFILQKDTRLTYVPIAIQKITIDTKKHMQMVREKLANGPSFAATVYKYHNIITSGGVEIRGIKGNSINRRLAMAEPVLEEYTFVAHRDWAESTLYNALTLCVQLTYENKPTISVKTVEVVDESDNVTLENLASPKFQEILDKMPVVNCVPHLVAPPERFDAAKLDDIKITDLKKVANEGNVLIAVGYNLLSPNKEQLLNKLLEIVKEDGFLVARENRRYSDKAVEKLNLNILLEKRVGFETIMLLRKRSNPLKQVKVVRVNNNEFSWLQNVQEILANDDKEREQDFRLVLVGEKDYENGLLGFLNCVRREPGGDVVVGVLIQDENGPEFSLNNPLYQKQLRLDLAVNVLQKGNVWGSYRHFLMPPFEVKPCQEVIMRQRVLGDLSTLHWCQNYVSPNYPDTTIIKVVYTALNFRDIMLATAKMSEDVRYRAEGHKIGIEFSGYTEDRKRVMGFTELSSALATHCRCVAGMLWSVPDEWSLEEAATVPAIYGTLVWALYMKTEIKRGQKILIHSGAGGVGQAAINLAHCEGLEIFTTVGTPAKRKFIMDTFPFIDESHIGCSHDTSFEQMIKHETNGQGVDIVINSLSEEKLVASLRCLAFGGKFIEIGKYDMLMNNSVSLGLFEHEITFYTIRLDVMYERTTEEILEFGARVKQLIDKGYIKPICRTIFDATEAETAYRYMSSGKHIGKVLLKMCDEDGTRKQPILAYPRFFCPDDKSYVLFGGLGGVGLELIDWMVLRGARKIVLISRTGIKNGYQQLRLNIWKSYGTNVHIISGKDVTNEQDVESILQSAEKMGPVAAIFNLGVVLKDAICVNQTVENFEESFRVKARLTKILDKLTRRLCPKLEHFVVFSSVSCGRGNPGQTNYGMSNSVMERICERRMKEGLPGLAVQWGAIGDVGLVADMMDNDVQLEIGGTLQQRITSCMMELEKFLLSDKPIVSSMVVAEKRLGHSKSLNTVETVAKILSVKDFKAISFNSTLAELGMDSMMAVEIKQTLERDFEVYLTAQDIRSLTFGKLAEIDDEMNNKKSTTKTEQKVEDQVLSLILRVIGSEEIYKAKYYTISTNTEASSDEMLFIAGVEGSGIVFLPLAQHLKSPAVCLQIELEADIHDSVPKMADLLFARALERLEGRKNFTMVAYSFGTVLALEVVKRLEADGCIGRLILIDGSHYEIKYQVTLDKITTEVELQHHMIWHTLTEVAYDATEGIMEEAMKRSTWEEKLDYLVEQTPNLNTDLLSVQTQRRLYTVVYKRFLAMMNYDPESLTTINSSITLIKPTALSTYYEAEDYGLSKVAAGKVEIHYVEGSHSTMLENSKIAHIINGTNAEDETELKWDTLDATMEPSCSILGRS